MQTLANRMHDRAFDAGSHAADVATLMIIGSVERIVAPQPILYLDAIVVAVLLIVQNGVSASAPFRAPSAW